jgi:catechol 2,3-dioxygenase-like lactoylglutathione lyase family enzyme
MILQSHPVFPTPDIKATAAYYCGTLGFQAIEYMNSAEPHICLYRDGVEIVLTSASGAVHPNRELYGYGYDAYFITEQQAELQQEFSESGAKIAKPLVDTDYQNYEFVVEDIDGRWLGFGVKGFPQTM